MKIYFFPGLGADETLAKYHRLEGHDIEWMRWPEQIKANWDEFLEDFQQVNKIEEGAIFAGISFGGVVAQKLASRKKPKGLILISSFYSSKSVSPFLYLFKPILSYLPAFIFDVRLLPTFIARYFRGYGND